MNFSTVKRWLFVLAGAFMLFTFSACSDDEEMDVYFLNVTESDDNFKSNLYLQGAIGNVFKEDTQEGTGAKVCTEKDGKDWLNKVCDYLISAQFKIDYPTPILETTFTVSLQIAKDNPDDDFKTVTSRTITIR